MHGKYGYDREKPYKVEKIAPKIYLANFSDRYDMAMTFLRYSEFYECPNEEFRGRRFKVLDYMDWYSKTFGDGAFTYANDWVGFNIPSQSIWECMFVHQLNNGYGDPADWSIYDEWMRDIYLKCVKDGEDFYLMGSVGTDNDTFLHELSHAMYATDPNYRFEQNQNIASMEEKDRQVMKEVLVKLGYADTDYIIKDETQAYISTGLPAEVTKRQEKRLQAYFTNFRMVFNRRNPLNIETKEGDNPACDT